MRTWLFPGSFDPPTFAHLDVAQRGAELCDRLIIGIGVNSAKNHLLEPKQRQQVWQELLQQAGLNDRTEVRIYQNATAFFAHELGCRVLLRGLRGERDWPWEAGVASVHASQDLETVYLGTDPRWSNLSSSLVREVHRAGLPLTDFVPPAVITALAAAAT